MRLWLKNYLVIGVVRKALGLTFPGDTRDAEAMIVGDVDIKGLDRDVSLAF